MRPMPLLPLSFDRDQPTVRRSRPTYFFCFCLPLLDPFKLHQSRISRALSATILIEFLRVTSFLRILRKVEVEMPIGLGRLQLPSKAGGGDEGKGETEKSNEEADEEADEEDGVMRN